MRPCSPPTHTPIDYTCHAMPPYLAHVWSSGALIDDRRIVVNFCQSIKKGQSNIRVPKRYGGDGGSNPNTQPLGNGKGKGLVSTSGGGGGGGYSREDARRDDRDRSSAPGQGSSKRRRTRFDAPPEAAGGESSSREQGREAPGGRHESGGGGGTGGGGGSSRHESDDRRSKDHDGSKRWVANVAVTGHDPRVKRSVPWFAKPSCVWPPQQAGSPPSSLCLCAGRAHARACVQGRKPRHRKAGPRPRPSARS